MNISEWVKQQAVRDVIGKVSKAVLKFVQTIGQIWQETKTSVCNSLAIKSHVVLVHIKPKPYLNKCHKEARFQWTEMILK